MAYLAAGVLALGACAQSNSETSVPQAPPDHSVVQGTPVSGLFPGGGSPPPADPLSARYLGDQKAIAEGARLFDWYNCAGCHFHGAGGIGPSLADDNWIYGGSMEQIYATIYQGRPNGMPSWGGKLSTTEIWEIAAYVRDFANKNAASAGDPVAPLPPVRDDQVRMPEIAANAPTPRQ
jgi:cytochrome c oxidase cbb3-type subunit 3